MNVKKKKPNSFSVRKRLLSFKYAMLGIVHVFKTQHNAWIHAMAAFCVVAAGFYFSLASAEWFFIILSIGLVFMAEIFNTAIEMLVDKISPEYDKIAGKIKDVAAGAVLITAIAAAIIGLLIFVPKVFG